MRPFLPLNIARLPALLRHCIEYIREYFDAPLVPNNGLNYKFPIRIDWKQLRKLNTLEACDEYIKKESHGRHGCFAMP